MKAGTLVGLPCKSWGPCRDISATGSLHCPRQRGRVRNTPVSPFLPSPCLQCISLARKSQLTWETSNPSLWGSAPTFQSGEGGNGGISLRAKRTDCWADTLETLRVCNTGPVQLPWTRAERQLCSLTQAHAPQFAPLGTCPSPLMTLPAGTTQL